MSQSLYVLSQKLSLFLNVEGIDFGESVNFAGLQLPVKPKKKRKNCTAKSRSCGYSCIKKEYNCKNPLKGQFKTYANWLKAQASKNTTAKVNLVSDHVITQNPRINTKSLDKALDLIQTPGAAERVANLKQFVTQNNIQAVFWDNSNPKSFKQAQDLTKNLTDKAGLPLTSDDRLQMAQESMLGIQGYTNSEFRHVVVYSDSSEGTGVFTPKATELTATVDRVVSKQVFAFSNADPDTDQFITYLHELGHQVHYAAGKPKKPKSAQSATRYSSTNDNEWFAEHFVMHMLDAEQYQKFDSKGAEFVSKQFKRVLKK